MNKKDMLILFVFTIVFTVLSIFNTGYEPVHSDEIIYLSVMKYQQDSSLYSRDLLISETLPDLPIPFYTLMRVVSNHIDISLSFFFVFILTRVLLILSVFLLAYTLFKNKVVSYLSVIAILLIRGNVGMVPGSYDILDKIVFPFFLAVPFLLFSVAFFLRKKYIISTILLAISTYLHATTSIFLLLLYGFYFLLNYKKINSKVILAALIFVVFSLPIFIKSFTAASSNIISLSQWIYFLKLRVSGHFFPTTWSFINSLLFVILIVLFLFSLKIKPEEEKNKKVILMSIGTLILFLISFIFTEIYPIKSVVQASLFRGLVIFRVIAIIYVINFIVNSLNYRRFLAYFMTLILISTAIVPIFTGAQKGVFSDVNITKKIGPWEDALLKAKELTPKDSLFITPPFSLGFTFFSERSEYINWKTSGIGVYSEKFVLEAIRRFEFVCKHEFNFKSRTELVEECKKGYNNLNEGDLELAREGYGVTHIIVENPKQLNFKLIYENKEYRIYEL